jgi:anti-sigma regulatory factor (Ser/Thr protein kinase)
MSQGALSIRVRADCAGAAVHARQLAVLAGWDRLEAEEFGLVVMELVSNVVRHATGGFCWLEADAQVLKAVVEDRGAGFSPAVLRDAGRNDRLGGEGVLPPGQRQGKGLGSGLACARRLTTELTLENLDRGGARVVATRKRMERRTKWRTT